MHKLYVLVAMSLCDVTGFRGRKFSCYYPSSGDVDEQMRVFLHPVSETDDNFVIALNSSANEAVSAEKIFTNLTDEIHLEVPFNL